MEKLISFVKSSDCRKTFTALQHDDDTFYNSDEISDFIYGVAKFALHGNDEVSSNFKEDNDYSSIFSEGLHRLRFSIMTPASKTNVNEDEDFYNRVSLTYAIIDDQVVMFQSYDGHGADSDFGCDERCPDHGPDCFFIWVSHKSIDDFGDFFGGANVSRSGKEIREFFDLPTSEGKLNSEEYYDVFLRRELRCDIDIE